MTHQRLFFKPGWFRVVLFIAGMAVWFGLTTPYTFAAADSGPCATSSEGRQLDYWLGDWVVTAPGGTGSSTSKVSLSLDKCLVLEKWGDGKDHMGENLFGYSADDKSWRGMFADNRGRVHVFVDGSVASGVAEFRGPSTGPEGQAVLNRVRIVRVTPQKVAQTWEKSTDKGATWTMAFRAEYTRKTP